MQSLKAAILGGMLAAAGQASPPQAADAAPAVQRFVTTHRGVFGGVPVSYVAEAAPQRVTGPEGATADVWTFSYLKAGGAADRPVLFVFNGGPGSASVWQHLGMFGPRRVAIADGVKPSPTPPYRLEDNPDCPLDVADVVLIDTVGTGFSRATPGSKAEAFYSAKADAQETLDVIEGWLTAHGRWNAPKLLVGESYGTIRAALMAGLSMGGPFTPGGRISGLDFNGVVLLGQALDDDQGPDAAYVELLPSYAAVAWRYGKVDRSRPLDQVIADARAFANGDYLKALWAGDRLSAAERDAVADRLSRLTGLPKPMVLNADLRVSAKAFESAILAGQGLAVGAYDARYTLPSRGAGPDPVGDDPAMAQYVPAFVGAMHQYLADDLKVGVDIPYESISFHAVNGRWDYGNGVGQPARRNFGQDLATAMRRNPKLRVMFGVGDYDLVTPLGATDYVAAHSDLDPARVEIRTYEAGHMVYLGADNTRKLGRDLRDFIAEASRP